VGYAAVLIKTVSRTHSQTNNVLFSVLFSSRPCILTKLLKRLVPLVFTLERGYFPEHVPENSTLFSGTVPKNSTLFSGLLKILF
jgi:hypothetical protein